MVETQSSIINYDNRFPKNHQPLLIKAAELVGMSHGVKYVRFWNIFIARCVVSVGRVLSQCIQLKNLMIMSSFTRD